MLVNLGSQASMEANTPYTFTYSPSSVQSIFIKTQDANTGTAYDWSCTVQLGSRTIVNSITGYGLFLYSQWRYGGPFLGNNDFDEQFGVCIDLGSWQMMNNENLYVTINNGSAVIDATIVCAFVDNPLAGDEPIKYTEYTDNTFTSPGVTDAIIYDAARAVVDTDTTNIEIRNSIQTSSPSVRSGQAVFETTMQGSLSGVDANLASNGSVLIMDQIPLATSFNYTVNVADTILVRQATPKNRASQMKAIQSAKSGLLVANPAEI